MPKIKPGLEVLIEQQLSLIRGQRVGLVTNHSAVDRNLIHIIDVLRAVGINLAALYAPEHGIRGDVPAGQRVPSGTDPTTGIPIHSLYGPTKRPSAEMLQGVDVLLFDVQDIGCRFYTYIHTMSCVMQACAQNRKKLIVLDRPNPVNGLAVEGNIPQKEFTSFVGLHPIPIRHGMTFGELALFFNNESLIGVDVDVVPCHGWKRAMWFDETGLPWVMPSPNMPTPETALLYPGLCLLEGTNASEGRGTTRPFEIIGAPWVDAYKLADRLNSADISGIRFRPVHFVPSASKYAQQKCCGVQAHVMSRQSISAVRVGLHAVKALYDLGQGEFGFLSPGPSGRHFFDLLSGTDRVRLAIQAGMPVDELIHSWYDDLREFMRTRQRYLLYS